MNRNLLKRLERLEENCQSDTFVLFTWCPNYKELLSRLAPGERIVQDVYRISGHFGRARARITTDPNDNGRTCEREGYLEDVIQEVHRTCEMRNRGECTICAGLSNLFIEDRVDQ